MSLSRREFVLTSVATTALGLRAADGEKPLLRIGAMSDDHLHPDRPATHRRTKACFELFRRQNVDIVVDTGDIADLSHVSELKAFRRYFDEAFAGTDCVPFFCIANHDYNYVPNTPKNDPRNIENAWRALGMKGPNPEAVVKGFRFVNVFQNEPRREMFAETVAKAVAANEGNRPVFVVNHVPPMETTAGTVHWSSRPVRDVLNKYPQVVALTGHNHTSIAWAGNVWQGEFTSVNLGAHAEYSNKIDGEAVVLEVFADRIDIRRYEAVSGREIGANDRWSIPLPLDPKNGPYRMDRRAKTWPTAALPADAVARFAQNKSGHSGTLTFTAAQPRNVAFRYLIALEAQQADGAWKYLGTLNWETPQVMDEPETWDCPLPPAMLDGGRPHRATVTPVNCFEVPGPDRTLAFSVPPCPLQALPAEAMRIVRYQGSTVPGENVFRPEADGWFGKKSGAVFLTFPKTFAALFREKRSVTLRFDIASEQKGRPNTYSIGKFPAKGGLPEMGVGNRIYTLPGKQTSHRYVWTIGPGKNPDPADEFFLVIREGDAARFRINDVRGFVN